MIPHYYADQYFQAICERKRISAAKKREIVECLGEGMKTLDIIQKHKQGHHTVFTLQCLETLICITILNSAFEVFYFLSAVIRCMLRLIDIN